MCSVRSREQRRNLLNKTPLTPGDKPDKYLPIKIARYTQYVYMWSNEAVPFKLAFVIRLIANINFPADLLLIARTSHAE